MASVGPVKMITIKAFKCLKETFLYCVSQNYHWMHVFMAPVVEIKYFVIKEIGTHSSIINVKTGLYTWFTDTWVIYFNHLPAVEVLTSPNQVVFSVQNC